MTFDLGADAAEIHTLLSDAVDLYVDARARSPSRHPEVHRVELAFLVGYPEPPVVYIDLDTRPDAQPDGDATHRCVAELRRPLWNAFLLPATKTVSLGMLDGSIRETDSDGVDQVLAEFLVNVLSTAHANGLFNRIADGKRLLLTVTYEGCPV